MQFDTNDIPQADLIWDVARVPEAIAQNLTTPSAIATYLGNKVPRQGLYYMQAAQILGLITRDASGEITLTTYGRTFISYDRLNKRRGLRRLVLECEPTRSIVAGLRASDGLSRDSMTRLIQGMVDLSDSTAHRRAQTITRWLCDLGLAEKNQGRLVYCGAGGYQRQAA